MLIREPQIKYTSWSEGRRRLRMVVTGGLHRIGTQAPYFTITATEEVRGIGNQWHYRAGGCMHDEILERWPELADLVALHLSSEDGTPMHALANARYFAGMTAYPDAANPKTLAEHLRISIHDAALMMTMDADMFAAAVEALRPRWKAEADAAIAKYGLKVFGS